MEADDKFDFRTELDPLLRRIESSGPFLRSDRSRELLRFLVEASLTGQNLSGKDIGARLLPHSDYYSNNVRQEVRRLRTKLAHYYEIQGKAEGIQLEIPTGTYRVQFNRKEMSRAQRALLVVPDPPEELTASLAKGETVLFAGAGLGAQAGLPTWRQAIKELLEFSRKNGYLDDALNESLEATIERGDYTTVADLISLRAAAQPAGLASLNRQLRLFLSSGGVRLSEAHRVLGSLPFSCAITSTFDRLVDKAFAQKGPSLLPSDTEDLKERISKRAFFTLHLNGVLEGDSSFVLTGTQLAESLAQNLAFNECLQTLIVSRPFLFIGCSLESVESLLAAIRFSPSAVSHFAVVSTQGNLWRTRADVLYRRYNVQLVPLSATRGFPELPAFAHKLSEVVEVRKREASLTLASVPDSVRVARLVSRLRLQNIGPFRSLDIGFQSNWAALLGGNGVGKSTILRAISAAYAGQSSERHVQGLLRTGATRGRIEIDTAQQKIVLDLQRTDRARGSAVKVTATPERPLELESELVIAFPALRSFRLSDQVDSTQAARSRPVPEDVYPMLKSDLDTRLSEIRKWLIDLDYKAKDARVRGGNEDSIERLRAHFFQALSDLAVGMRIELDSVDIDRGQIHVRTDDGVVPIDTLSQGTSSLMCWVGVLLHRLYEVHGADRAIDFDNLSAVVMIDEIDTHMHPLWQRLLVGRLRKLFPRVQFIVTTHSPLVVSSLSQVEIFMFRREGEDISCSNPPIDVRGLRADQILTSPLFDLDGTRDPETQRLLNRYTELCSRTTLSEKEESELRHASQVLGLRIHSSEEREEARTASRMIQEVFRKQIDEMDTSSRKSLLAELDAQLLETKSGRRRPN